MRSLYNYRKKSCGWRNGSMHLLVRYEKARFLPRHGVVGFMMYGIGRTDNQAITDTSIRHCCLYRLIYYSFCSFFVCYRHPVFPLFRKPSEKMLLK